MKETERRKTKIFIILAKKDGKHLRIDVYLSENGFCTSRSRAQELIKSGAVQVNGKIITKSSFQLAGNENVICIPDDAGRYVSRGGIKLEAALKHFAVSPVGLICADIGASTGGFTDCLLQYGAEKVYAIDSGTAQLDKKLRKNPHVVSIESLNARYLSEEDIGEKCALVVMDVSFISQTKLFSSVIRIISNGGIFISLIKPQFEVGRSGIGKGGIVRDEKKRIDSVRNVCYIASDYGLQCRGTIPSPITGGDGNQEYLACFSFCNRKEVGDP